jgi:hypothetical protein
MELSTFSIAEEEEAEVVQTQLKEAYHKLQREAILDNADPEMCHAHDAFGTFDTPNPQLPRLPHRGQHVVDTQLSANTCASTVNSIPVFRLHHIGLSLD